MDKDDYQVLEQVEKKKLLDGYIYLLNNEDWCDDMQLESYAVAEVLHKTEGPNWSQGFIIWLNGRIVHQSKTFSSLKSNLLRLIEKWHLTIPDERNDEEKIIGAISDV